MNSFLFHNSYKLCSVPLFIWPLNIIYISQHDNISTTEEYSSNYCLIQLHANTLTSAKRYTMGFEYIQSWTGQLNRSLPLGHGVNSSLIIILRESYYTLTSILIMIFENQLRSEKNEIMLF